MNNINKDLDYFDSFEFSYINYEKIFYNLLTPKEIYKYLDSNIIGQEEAKKILSVNIYNHFKKLSLNYRFNFDLNKSNILMIGPSGSGKTFLIQKLSELLNIPLVIIDATSLTEAGYVGEDVENILQKLFYESGWDVQKTEKGIVYIDEIDKISKKSNDSNNNRDISGEGVQQALLKFIEGTNCLVSNPNSKKNQNYINLNTSDILFICGGSFYGLDKIISERIENFSLGFLNNLTDKKLSYNNIMKFLEFEDLVKFGIIPELIGRLPVILKLNDLDINSLKKILLNPNNSVLYQYNLLFSSKNIILIIDDDAADIIAHIALKKKTGARGLKNIVDSILFDVMYEIEDFERDLKEIIIHKYVFDERCKTPLLVYK